MGAIRAVFRRSRLRCERSDKMMKRVFLIAGTGMLAAVLVLVICYLIFGWGLGRSEKSASCRLAASWEAPGGLPFDQPYAVGVDPRNGKMLVTDAQNQRVVVFDPTGSFLRQFGKKGDANGEFALPSGVAAGPDGTIYVADYMQDQLLGVGGVPQVAWGWHLFWLWPRPNFGAKALEKLRVRRLAVAADSFTSPTPRSVAW